MRKQLLSVVLIAVSMTLASSCFKGQAAIAVIAQPHLPRNTSDVVSACLTSEIMADLRTGLNHPISSWKYMADTSGEAITARAGKTEFKEVNEIGTDVVVATILIVAYAFWMILKSFKNSAR